MVFFGSILATFLKTADFPTFFTHGCEDILYTMRALDIVDLSRYIYFVSWRRARQDARRLAPRGQARAAVRQ